MLTLLQEKIFIDDTVLLATSPRKLRKKKCASKIDPTTKYQLVHLSRKRNTDINKAFLLDDNYTTEAQKSGIPLGVEIDNWIALKYEPQKKYHRSVLPNWISVGGKTEDYTAPLPIRYGILLLTNQGIENTY